MHDYISNINQAIEDSRIEFINQEAKSCLDQHTHLYERKIEQGVYPAVFGEYNTRGLSLYSSELLIDTMRTKRSLKILELGAGSGRAAYDIYTLVHNCGLGVTIDTVALTPFAPNYRLLLGYDAMVESFAGFYDSNIDAGELKWVKDALFFYYQMYKWKVDPKISPFELLERSDFIILIDEAKKRPWGLPIYAAFELNRIAYNFFKPCSDYVNKQYIGKLIDNESIYANKYDFIHDEWGALHYTLRYEEDDKALRALIMQLYESLNSNGKIYIAELKVNKLKLFDQISASNLITTYLKASDKSVQLIIKK